MLHELHVRDLALIQEAWLEIGPGMTVLTGETGAGKTVLLGALKLLLGDRADSGSVRAGAKEALIEGEFSAAGEQVLVSRRVGVDARSRCRIDGEMANVGALAERIGPLVDLHGQHEHQALLSAATHLGYLDRWAGDAIAEPLAAYRAALAAHRAALAARVAVEERAAAAARDEDYLRFVLAEIDAVGPEPGEDEALESRLPALQHAEKLAEATAAAAAALRGEGGALDRVAVAAGALARVAGIDPALDELAGRLRELETLVDDVGMGVRAYRDGIEHDPRVLDELLGRLSAISALKKKYGPGLEQVLERRDEARAAIEVATDSDAALAAARAAESEAESALRDAAGALSDARRSCVAGFIAALTAATEDLAMPGASFEIAITEQPFSAWNDDGPDRVEFLYSPAAGQPARPLTRIASGGEVSRVMLALKGVLGGADSVETLVFDEVDAGIGGQTAHAVGCRLKELSRTHQVLVVTHLAQVAAFADAQLVVSKETLEGEAVTKVTPVEGEERVAEIARMLAGNTSDRSLAHARELLEAATASGPGA